MLYSARLPVTKASYNLSTQNGVELGMSEMTISSNQPQTAVTE